MNSMLTLTVATIAALVAIIFSLQTPFLHLNQVLAPPQISGTHDYLHSATVIPVTGAIGPESLIFDPNGDGPYTGVADGRVLKWQGDGRGWTDFAVTTSQRSECIRPFALELEHVCGRPLGLRFDKKTRDLYIADAYLGLHVVGPAGGLATKLVTEFEGKPLRFTNDLDIDEEGDVIYFTDSSTVFQRRQFMASILSGDSTGRLFKYDRDSKQVTVLLQGLAFANGVALSKDKSHLLVVESTTGRILRFWVRGPEAGNLDVLAKLPGYPDNIRRNPKGEYWVALHAKKGLVGRLVSSNSWFGKVLLKLPVDFKKLHGLLVGGKAHATAVRLSEEGEILEVLEDCEGKTLKFISEVEEKDGKLWFGSVLMPFVGVFELK
ncbi:protein STRICTOSIDINE SYNTHASE-LIKE 10-like [Cucurbita maxima]|uniref:Protein STRICTOSIDINE SYNTHASE-LIKE 10-like n=1 Tax=Cucurbita maxima TaxID=3661 RepID=A0A6J1I6Y9_CUCMA|nr:protein STRICTOSIDINE SYNTHASE-LIKE 10-like [Cucurbita maxima]